MELNDEEIVKFLQQEQVSEEEKNKYFIILVDKYKDKLYQLIYNYIKDCGTLHDAEEILLSTFTNFWSSIKKFSFKSSISTYIYRIAINLALNFVKKNKKNYDRTVLLDDVSNELKEKDITEIIQTNEEKNLLQKKVQSAINQLPPNQKLALILAKYEKKSYKEIAEIMNTSISSVESLLFRARQNLKKILKGITF